MRQAEGVQQQQQQEQQQSTEAAGAQFRFREMAQGASGEQSEGASGPDQTMPQEEDPNKKDKKADEEEKGDNDLKSAKDIDAKYDSSPHHGWAAKIHPTLDPAVDEAAEKERKEKKGESGAGEKKF